MLIAHLSTSFFIAHAAGGRIEGKLTDPKGAAIPGATVIITNQITKQDFTTVTDGQGKYKVFSSAPKRVAACALKMYWRQVLRQQVNLC